MREAVVPGLAVSSRRPADRKFGRLLAAALLAAMGPWPGAAHAAEEGQPAAPAAPAAPETTSPTVAPAPPTVAPPAKPPEMAGTPATVIDGQQVESVLGKSVQSASGEDMGRIVDVIADKAGQARAVIIDFGGFFGMGSRKIAVDWHALHFSAEKKSDKVVVDLPRNQLRTAPVYKEGEPVVVLGASAGAPAGPASSSSPPAEPTPPSPAP